MRLAAFTAEPGVTGRDGGMPDAGRPAWRLRGEVRLSYVSVGLFGDGSSRYKAVLAAHADPEAGGGGTSLSGQIGPLGQQWEADVFGTWMFGLVTVGVSAWAIASGHVASALFFVLVLLGITAIYAGRMMGGLRSLRREIPRLLEEVTGIIDATEASSGSGRGWSRSRMTPEAEARYALNFGVARGDLPEAAQVAYDRLAAQVADDQVVAQRARAQPSVTADPAGAWTAGEMRRPVSSARSSPGALRAAIGGDVVVLAAAAAFYLAIAVTNIASWPANRVLISADHDAAGFFAIWLLFAYSVLSNVLLYGWPYKGSGPGSVLRAIFWGSRRRPSWAKLPPSMRRPPGWLWLLLAVAVAGSVTVLAGSIAAGAGKSQLRILPGPRYLVSALGLHDGAWTQVSHATYQAYAAGAMRLSSLVMPFLAALIANCGYALFLRRELLRIGLADSRPPAS